MSLEQNASLPDWASKIIGALAVLAGALSTYAGLLKYRLAKHAGHKPSFGETLRRVESELAVVRLEFSELKDVKMLSLERRLFAIELKSEDDWREILHKVTKLESSLRSFNSEVHDLREHLEKHGSSS